MKTIHHGSMGRRFILDVAACGAVTIRDSETKGHGKTRQGLPVFSTDTEQQAKALQVTHCRLARDGSGIYRLNEPPKSVDDLPKIEQMFAATYVRLAAAA